MLSGLHLRRVPHTPGLGWAPAPPPLTRPCTRVPLQSVTETVVLRPKRTHVHIHRVFHEVEARTLVWEKQDEKQLPAVPQNRHAGQNHAKAVVSF